MAMSKKVEDAINEQINKEFYSAYLYLAMEAYFDSMNLKGFGNWMRVQAEEEVTHAMKFFDNLNERGARADLKAIAMPKKEWKSPLEAFEDAYNHEVFVTKCIHDIVTIAEAEKDRASVAFLQWYVDEQVEEEASTDEIRRKLLLIKNEASALLLIDQELAQRVFTNGAGVPSSITVKKQMAAAKAAP